MTTVSTPATPGKPAFDDVLRPFLQQPGLAFADVLDAATIEQAFAQRDGLFATDAVFSTEVVLLAFLAQVLRDGKGAACAAAVADIATHAQQTGRAVPSGDTGDYCRARAKLDPDALRDLVGHTAGRLEQDAPADWLWHGRHAKLVDGFTVTMADTPANQDRYPQAKTQAPGVGLPIARAVAVLSLATAAIHDVAIGPYTGKATGETALLRRLLASFDDGDIVVADRYYCSFMMLAQLARRGVDVCARLHQCRKDHCSDGQRLGPDDRLVTWTRPARPPWMSAAEYEQVPPTLTLRMIRFEVTEPGRRVESITVVTTLTDPVAYPPEDIAELFSYRWNAELDIRAIKETLGLDHVPCKSPAMVGLHLWVTLLGYTLIRGLIATAATAHDKQPRQLGFTLACQTVLSSWMLLATGACRDVPGLIDGAMKRIAANVVANRPGRIEPRAVKRRPKPHKLLRISRQQWKHQWYKEHPSCN